MSQTVKCVILSFALLMSSRSVLLAQEVGGIRGTVYDKDFDVPLVAAEVLVVETGEKTTTGDEGNFVFGEVDLNTYTLVFSKEGYTRQVMADVVVSAGRMSEVEASLAGEFVEMEEFIVQDLELGGGSEIGLLNLRLEDPSLMDSISADLMSQAGASDAAGALRLVSGATVTEGKYAVVRGLPDRYVNSQLNAVRLPTADADKRAVQLDQFPAALVESIQVKKTFTPDQQGDASGGAVNVVTKGIPEETLLRVSGQVTYDSHVTGKDVLTYKGGGVSCWGFDDGRRDIQGEGRPWDGAVGVTSGDGPMEYKWSLSGGGKHELDTGLTIGGFGSFFYERDSSFYDHGFDDKYWVEDPGDPMTPQYTQGSPEQDAFKTQLFDVAQGSEEVKWGSLATFGWETENHALTLLYMYTRAAEDVATLAEDTRGKAYYFPGYDRDDPNDPGNLERDAAPYLRTETLEYTERTTQTLQLSGHHTLGDPDWAVDDFFRWRPPELHWGLSFSSADLYQPDKRLFGSLWWAESYNPGFPPFVPPFTTEEQHRQFKPAETFTLGNLQRIWKEISEESEQYFLNGEFPFEQWNGQEGYLKVGLFNDQVDRRYKQESFSNFNDNVAQYQAPWEDFWSEVFPFEVDPVTGERQHPITGGEVDVDYDGEQEISAWYGMLDLPVHSSVKVIGGVRFESTELDIVNYPESEVTWIPPSTGGADPAESGRRRCGVLTG